MKDDVEKILDEAHRRTSYAANPDFADVRRRAVRIGRSRALATGAVGAAAFGTAVVLFLGVNPGPSTEGITPAGSPTSASVPTPKSTQLPTPVAPADADVPGIPREFANACGRSGSSVQIRRAPLWIDASKCDLVGVGVIYMQTDGSHLPLTVQGRREGTSLSGGDNPKFAIDVDKKSGDLTITLDEPAPAVAPVAGVAAELWPGCSRPGTTVTLTSKPATVRYEDCDLGGVKYKVALPGGGGLGIDRNPVTGDVSFSESASRS